MSYGEEESVNSTKSYLALSNLPTTSTAKEKRPQRKDKSKIKSPATISAD